MLATTCLFAVSLMYLMSGCWCQQQNSNKTVMKSVPIQLQSSTSSEPDVRFVRFNMFEDDINTVSVAFCEEHRVPSDQCLLLVKYLTNYVDSEQKALAALSMPTDGNTFSFTELGRKYGTDKVLHHRYDRFYPRYIEQYRSLPPGHAMLEIGVNRFYSLNMWLEYYPNAFIYCIDIDFGMSGDRFEIFKADQGERGELKRIVDEGLKHPLFLIVDDASHYPQHQVLSFDVLFGALMPGGTYIVEDIEQSYWVSGDVSFPSRHGYHHKRSTMELFKHVLDDVNREYLNEDSRRTQELLLGNDISLATRQMISTVTFALNCIIITKKTEEEHLNDNRVYGFKQFI